MPALSADGSELAFSLHGDIWRCKASGGVAERVTAHSAYDGYPAWSPDGRWIAFSSKREGGFDVFIIPSGGGEAVRKTHHPADDLVCDWSPDGREVLFSSARLRATPDLYTVAVADGRVRRVTNDPGGARFGRYDADGKRVAYTCGRQEWWQIGYQGSARAHVKTHRLDTGATETLPDGPGYTGMTAAGRAMLFCVAAHDGQVGIRRAAWAAGAWLPVVADGADPISWLTCARSGTLVVYEKAGDLWAVDGVAAGAPRRIEIVARTDVRSMPVTTVRQTNGFSHLALSPDGKTLALAASGDLWTAPVGGGDATRLTTTRGDETWPAWSPDGKLLVFAAYRDGQVDLFLRDMAEKSERRETNDAAIEERPLFAPGGDRIAFVRADGPDSGLVVHYLQAPDAEPLGPETRVWQGRDIAGFDWSPDGRWLAFSATEGRGVRDIMVAPSVGGEAVNATRAAGELRWPRWSRDGRLIACVGTLWSVSDIAEAGVVVVPLVPDLAEDGPPGSQSAGRPGPGRG
ncbi:MAG: hypothetical protein FJX72_21870, partial [Armatimonadetes bacterium]|nr:hypothetical protein [Armatimonadota bacterium]